MWGTKKNSTPYKTAGSLVLLLSLVCLISCKQNTFDSEKELWTYLKEEKNGFQQHKTVNGIDFTLTYRPTDLLVKQELGEAVTGEAIDSLRTKYRQFLYFNLSMSQNNKELLSTVAGSRAQFGAMVNQFAFGMGDKVHLFTREKDTIPLLDYVYPRMYGMSNSTSMLFVYPRDEKITGSEYINITVEDIGLGTGDITFKIPVKTIKREPKLNFNALSL